jgi:hypothetical protein
MDFTGMHLLCGDLMLFRAYCVMMSLHALKGAFSRFRLCMLAMEKLKINYDQIAIKKSVFLFLRCTSTLLLLLLCFYRENSILLLFSIL